jgi:hypothetical protein
MQIVGTALLDNTYVGDLDHEIELDLRLLVHKQVREPMVLSWSILQRSSNIRNAGVACI